MKSRIEEAEDLLRNPEPGTAAAAARDFGIDLTLTIAQLRRTPAERIRRLAAARESVNALRRSTRKLPQK